MSYPKLRGAIREKYGTQEAFTDALKIAPATLSSKLTAKTEWTREEIEKAVSLLDIPVEDIHTYFFNT